MTAPRRRAADSLLPFLAVALAIIAIGCGPATPATSRPARSSPAPSLTAVPGGPASPVVRASVGPPSTTDTEFGTIFDALPPSFPKLPGQEPAETGAGPTSGSFAVNMDVDTASSTIISALKAQGWTVESLSSLEGGVVVIDLTGPSPGCTSEVRFTPFSGTLIMSVLYGASCPFS